MSDTLYSLTLFSDPALSDDLGNKLNLEASLVEVQGKPGEPAIVDFQITVNTEEETCFGFELTLNQAQELGQALQKFATTGQNKARLKAQKAFEFTQAKLSCAKGQVGLLVISKIGEVSAASEIQMIDSFTLKYYDDLLIEPTLIHQIDDFTSQVPADQEGQFDWLRALVGGNHQYTSTIKVQLEGFSFDEVTQRFDNLFSDYLNRHS